MDVNDVKGTMDSLRGEMKGDVKNLEAEMAHAFSKEGLSKEERQ